MTYVKQFDGISRETLEAVAAEYATMLQNAQEYIGRLQVDNAQLTSQITAVQNESNRLVAAHRRFLGETHCEWGKGEQS